MTGADRDPSQIVTYYFKSDVYEKVDSGFPFGPYSHAFTDQDHYQQKIQRPPDTLRIEPVM